VNTKNRKLALKAVKTLLGTLERGPLRPELIDTPRRVVSAYEEMLDGYSADIDSLFKTFDGEGSDQLSIVKNIPFSSLCEHHLLTFMGKAHVGYLPNGKVIGASKIPRLVLAFSHRLQLQERIAEQVAHTLMSKLQPHGVAVVIEGTHLCMTCRGVKAHDTSLISSVMLGKFREDSTLRAEFLSLLKMEK